jgi:hypothetical protein
MVRKAALGFLVVCIVVFGVAADKKKTTSGGTTTTVATSTAVITASEGSTAMAIRGIVEPVDGVVIIGFKNGAFTARNRITGSTFKFNAAQGSYSVGQAVPADIVRANIANAIACCQVAAINRNSLTVNEKVLGRSFVVQGEPTSDMRVGQTVSANFKLGTASIGSWSGPITNLSQCAALYP